MKSFKTLSLFLFSISLIPLFAQSQPAIPETIKMNIRDRIDNGENKNIIIGVVDQKGKHYYSYGHISAKTKLAPKKHTLYEIGSVSKVFTGLALAMEAHDKHLSLEDPINGYLPDSVQFSYKDDNPIQLLHLSNHHSGLPRDPGNLRIDDIEDPFGNYTTKSLWEFLSNVKLTRSAGEKYEYSNVATGLLGQILADKQGMSYDELIYNKISKPLDMPDTRVLLNSDQQLRISPGHLGNKTVKNWKMGSLEGAGAIKSSASDLLTFLIYQMELYPSSLTQAMRLSQKGTAPLTNEKDSVALGWHIKHGEQSKIIWHNGQTGGYHSFVGFDKKQKKGVVVLSNSTISIDDIGLHYLDASIPLKEIKEVFKVGVESLDQYVGVYELIPGTEITVRRDQLQLTAQLTGQGAYEIYPESEQKFFLRVVDAQVEFNKNDQGEVESLTLFQNGMEQQAKKISDEVPEKKEKELIVLSEKDLDTFTGEYDLIPGVAFTVTREGAQLYVKVTNQAALPVYPLSKNRFFYKAVDAEIEFELTGGEKSPSLTLFQNGLEQKARRK